MDAPAVAKHRTEQSCVRNKCRASSALVPSPIKTSVSKTPVNEAKENIHSGRRELLALKSRAVPADCVDTRASLY
jgi:hypothetical protein